MERNNKKIMYKIIIVLIIVSSILSVVFAALSKTLTVNVGNLTQIATKWNISVSSTSAINNYGSSSTGRDCGTISTSNNVVTVTATTLSKPGDLCEYSITFTNGNSTMNAKLDSLTATAPSGNTCTYTTFSSCTSGNTCQYKMVCGNITYTLSSNESGTSAPTNLASFTGGTTTSKTVYLRVEFTGSSPSGSAITQTNPKFTVVYAQN